MVDTCVSGAYEEIREGSTPFSDTIKKEVKRPLFQHKPNGLNIPIMPSAAMSLIILPSSLK